MEVSLYHPQRLLERAAPVQMPQLSLPSDPFYSTPSMGNWQLGIHRPCNADHCHITHFPAPMPGNIHLPASMSPVTQESDLPGFSQKATTGYQGS